MSSHSGQKLQYLGKQLFRIGIIGASLFSGYLLISIIRISFISFLGNISFFGTLLSLVIGSIGCLFYLGGVIISQTLIKEQMLETIRSIQLYTIVSLILVTWTLVLIPTLISAVIFFQVPGILQERSFLFPFYPSEVHSLSIYEDAPLPLNFLWFYLMRPNGNPLLGFFRLVGIGFVIFTCICLFQQLRYLFNDWKTLQNDYSLMLMIFEAAFNIVLLIYLVLNLTIPLWEFFDPMAYLSTIIFRVIGFPIVPFFSLFVITFLTTGSTTRSYLLINNVQSHKLRLFVSIGIAFLSSAPHIYILIFPYL